MITKSNLAGFGGENYYGCWSTLLRLHRVVDLNGWFVALITMCWCAYILGQRFFIAKTGHADVYSLPVVFIDQNTTLDRDTNVRHGPLSDEPR